MNPVMGWDKVLTEKLPLVTTMVKFMAKETNGITRVGAGDTGK
jgi:hypothetical protein